MFRTLYCRVLAPLLMALCIVAVGVPLKSAAQNSNSGQPSWTNPSAMTTKRVSKVSDERHEPVFLNNLDCTPLTYRLVGSSEMRTGCFTRTAFGALDSDNEIVIFNGSDEGVPLSSYSSQEVLAPWTNALDLLTLDAASTGGSYLGMYKNPLPYMHDQINWKGQATSKQLTAPPDTIIKDTAGRPTVINPQTMAGSSSGSWLVVETLSGSFTRINLASLGQLPFAKAFGSQGSPSLLKSQVAINDTGRYVAIDNDIAASFRLYDLSTCGSDTVSWQSNGCQSYDYWPFISHQIKGLSHIRHVRFINDGLLSFEAVAGEDSVSGVYELAPRDSIASLIDYLGLGDSYTSGEGAFDYSAGTDTSDNTCHLSARSYPLLLTHDLFGGAGGHSVACSGAVIDDVISLNGDYKGQVKNGSSLRMLESNQPERLDAILSAYSPGYVPQRVFVKQFQPNVITVSVGGNDVGFGDILQKCVVPHISRHQSDETCYNTYESRQELVNLVDRTVPRWTALFRQLQADSLVSNVYAVGYPSIASDYGKCPLNVELSKSELEFAEEMIHYLNDAIEKAAASANISYVDVSRALYGYRLCEGGSATGVNGLTAGNDFGLFGVGLLGRESYHPNALGHELIEQAILRQTDNLSSAKKALASGNDYHNLLDAPKVGRKINDLIPDDHLVEGGVVHTGGSVTISVDGLPYGLLPNGQYLVRFDGPEGKVLASLTSNAKGNLSDAVVIPPDASDGRHTIDITGYNQAGEPVDVTQSVFIPSDIVAKISDNSSDAGQPSVELINLQTTLTQHTKAVKSHVLPAIDAEDSSKEKSLGVQTARKQSWKYEPVVDRAPKRSLGLPSSRAMLVASTATLITTVGLQKIIKYWREL